MAAQKIESLRAALAGEGSTGVAKIFRELLADREMAAVFGAFAFKLMPHLMPPLEGNPAFWSVLVEEFAALAATASQVSEDRVPAVVR